MKGRSALISPPPPRELLSVQEFESALQSALQVSPNPAREAVRFSLELPEDLAGVNCDLWTNFDDIPMPSSGEFVKTDHCIGGVYPIELQGPGHEASYQQSKSLLYAVLATYNGMVDLGQTPDVKEAVEQMSPPLTSTYLRDLLLQHHPLSDEVLVAMLKRLVPMDPWHQTQVLLQNSRLNAGVWAVIQDNGLLTPYFRALVAQAQGEEEGPTMKQALEMEIVERRREMTGHIIALGTLYARDTVNVPSDSLRKLFRHELDKQFLQKRLEWLIADRDLSGASDQLTNEMSGYNGRAVMADLIALQQSSAGAWRNLNSSERTLLQDHAAEGKVGAPRAAGILFSIGEMAALPVVAFPDFTKSRSPRTVEGNAEGKPDPTIACFPNPAGSNTFVTYPADLDGAVLQLHDAKGMLIMTHVLKGNGLFEMDVRHLPIGLYHVSVSGTLLAVKLTVQD
ncbi:MAG: T9SS type A sorting domain-containing protein [Flavobacteriales bacterium]|nr:T9SS type A sorting domain-containing protein [Flavobacteriales bacterium]